MDGRLMAPQRRSARLVAGAACVCLGWASPGAKGEPIVIAAFDQPLTFSYGTWDGRVTSGEGHLAVHGVNGKGGGGCVAMRDLSPHARRVPALRVRVGAGNQAAGIALLLTDQSENAAPRDVRRDSVTHICVPRTKPRGARIERAPTGSVA
jgi:hypothetical protein